MPSSQDNNETYEKSELQENFEILREIYFFSSLPLERLKVLAYVCIRETFRQGEFLFRQGEDDGQAIFIISGKVHLICRSDCGELVVRNYGANDFLGGMNLLGRMPRLFSLQAIETTTCLILQREKFSSTIQQFPELIPKVMEALVERINAWEARFLTSHHENCDTCRQIVGFSLL